MIYVMGPILSLLNLAFIIFGANVYAPNALWYGLGIIALAYTHFLVPALYSRQGVWPEAAQKHLQIEPRVGSN
jgi:peptidoglycan biosynthesis protein MviN/MurJ (putative lipid II flippase)